MSKYVKGRRCPNNSQQPEGDHGISKVLIVDKTHKSVKQGDREVATEKMTLWWKVAKGLRREERLISN